MQCGRRNLFYGGTLKFDGWEESIRTEEPLKIGKSVLAEAGRMTICAPIYISNY